MGFFDKARAAATDLAGRAETMITEASSGVSGQGTTGLYAELGRLVYAEHQGQAPDPARKGQLIAQIETHEAQAAQAATAPPPPGTPAASPEQPRPTAPPQPPQDEPRPQTPPPPPPPPTS